MHDRFYSTADLARICGVSISTIKRWTDSGLVRCVRTPGGHRKFRVQDVAEAARKLGTPMAAPESPPESAARIDELALLLLQNNRAALVERAAVHLQSGDCAAMRTLASHLHRHGMRAGAVADELLRPAVAALLEGPTRDPEHDFVRRRALHLVEMAARHLQDELPPPLLESPLAIVAGAPGTEAGPWPALGALVLAECGWNLVELGADVPWTTLHQALARLHPALAVIVHTSAAARDLEALRAQCQEHGAQLALLPGPADEEPGLAGLVRRARGHERLLGSMLV